MYPTFVLLLMAYAICFGIQHKVPFFHRKFDWLDNMLECTYCTGFHAGWVTWALTHALLWKAPVESIGGNILSVISWAFASAIFCYIADALVKWFEVNSVEIEEE
tara:strand:+ start:366 stop:680 length:315 start_codon:yes stop_codon:yes gene_type:complete